MKLGSVFALFFFVTYVSDSLVSGTDPAVTPGAKGAKVVDDVVKRIKDSGIFPDDHDFLRRIAQTESRCGDDPNTYRPGYHGGIWQVDEDTGFFDSQDTASHEDLGAKLDKVKEKFGIDWREVKREDLRKPLYSALAARLMLSNIQPAIPEDLNGQAAYWKKYYNTEDGDGTVEDFLERVGSAKGDPHVCQQVKGADDQLCYDVFGDSGDVYTFLDEPSLYKFKVKAELRGKHIGKVTITSDTLNGPAIIDMSGIAVNNVVYAWRKHTGNPQQLTFGDIQVSIGHGNIGVELHGLVTVTLTKEIGSSINLNMDIEEVGGVPDTASGIMGDVIKYVEIGESKNEAVIYREDGTATTPVKLGHRGDKWYLPNNSSPRFQELLSNNKE